MIKPKRNIIPRPLKLITKPLRKHYLPFYMKISEPKPDPEAVKLYPKYVTDYDCVVEVGAGIGGGTLKLSKKARYVYAFEPNPTSRFILKHFTKNKHNVVISKRAIGEKNSESMNLNIIENNLYSGLATFKTRNDVKFTNQIKVKMVRLDDFFFRIRPTMLILDCTGYEFEVLKGARETLQDVDKVLVELHCQKYVKDILKNIKSELKNFDVNVDESLEWLIAVRRKNA